MTLLKLISERVFAVAFYVELRFFINPMSHNNKHTTLNFIRVSMNCRDFQDCQEVIL